MSNNELPASTERLVRSDRETTATLVAHLGEIDARKLYLSEGFSSLFTHCTALGFSEHEAYNRIEVARAARRFPTILDMLASGSVNVTTVRRLSPHLTTDN